MNIPIVIKIVIEKNIKKYATHKKPKRKKNKIKNKKTIDL